MDSIPVITGIADFTYYIGDVRTWFNGGVVANDVLDGNLIVNLNIGNLDFSEPEFMKLNIVLLTIW